jgi:hypothetical protein
MQQMSPTACACACRSPLQGDEVGDGIKRRSLVAIIYTADHASACLYNAHLFCL